MGVATEIGGVTPGYFGSDEVMLSIKRVLLDEIVYGIVVKPSFFFFFFFF